jgi:hypothetical protein
VIVYKLLITDLITSDFIQTHSGISKNLWNNTIDLSSNSLVILNNKNDIIKNSNDILLQ